MKQKTYPESPQSGTHLQLNRLEGKEKAVCLNLLEKERDKQKKWEEKEREEEARRKQRREEEEGRRREDKRRRREREKEKEKEEKKRRDELKAVYEKQRQEAWNKVEASGE